MLNHKNIPVYDVDVSIECTPVKTFPFVFGFILDENEYLQSVKLWPFSIGFWHDDNHSFFWTYWNMKILKSFSPWMRPWMMTETFKILNHFLAWLCKKIEKGKMVEKNFDFLGWGDPIVKKKEKLLLLPLDVPLRHWRIPKNLVGHMSVVVDLLLLYYCMRVNLINRKGVFLPSLDSF